MMRVLILGATGMLGHTLFAHLVGQCRWELLATSRDSQTVQGHFPPDWARKVQGGVDAEKFDSVMAVFADFQPDVVINCIGLIKQSERAQDTLAAIDVNARFPHRLAILCRATGARLIHLSTDCVFDGAVGGYREADIEAPTDNYGHSKLLGEVDGDRCLTLRTSIIGHELRGGLSLLEWFLAENERVRGFTGAIYSGFPTVELARILGQFVLPNEQLSGLYHVSSEPICKYDLLKLVAEHYGKHTEIEPYADFHIDRSLDSQRFRQVTGYTPPSWPELIEQMHSDFMTAPFYSGRPERKEVD